MLHRMELEAICQKHGYDYGSVMGETVDYMRARANGVRLKLDSVKDTVRDIIKAHVPYSFYGPEPIELDYDEMAALVKTMDGDRIRYDDTIAVDFFDVMEFREDVKSTLKDIRTRIYASERTNPSQKIDYKGHQFNLNIKHLILLTKERCQCDICGVKASFVAMGRLKDKPHITIAEVWGIGDDRRARRMTVDHKLARSLGGRDWMPNMIPMCNDCNSKKSSIESKIIAHNRCIEGLADESLYPFECCFYP